MMSSTGASAKALRTTAPRISWISGSSSTIRISMLGLAPADGLEQAYAGGYGDVETFYLSAHRNPHQEIAALARQAAHALAFGAEHPGDRVRQVGLVEGLLGALV